MKMAPWPPSPSVEDEDTALANEHSIDAPIQAPKSENQPANDRGAVDQYPIIIDSPDQTRPSSIVGKSTPIPEPLASDISSSEDCAGPPTPPPLLRKEQNQTSNGQSSSTHGLPRNNSTPSPPANARQDSSSRGRPHMTRIQTDMSADVSAMATGNRRPPSPYAYSRAPTIPGTSTGHNAPMETFLSPTHAVASPGSAVNQHRQTSTTAHNTVDRLVVPPNSTFLDNSQQSRPKSQRGNSHTGQSYSQSVRSSTSQFESGSTYRPSQDTRRQSYHEDRKRHSADYAPLSPPHSRRASKELAFYSSSDDQARRRSPPYSRRDTQQSKYSPHASSAEESSRSHGKRSERGSGEEVQRARRRSSRLHERPILVDSRTVSNAQNVPSSATAGQQSKHYEYDPRNESFLESKVIHPNDMGRTVPMEQGMFDRAFRANVSRTRIQHSPRSSGSALASPMSSPPRTPKFERQSKDYFDATPTLQRPVQRSRPPSIDEGQSRDLRAHSTLLSAATTGAAIAARVSCTTTRSSGQSTETSSSSATSKNPSAPRSRGPSPVTENFQPAARTAAYSPADQHTMSPATLLPSYSGRPMSRGSATASDSNHYHPQPHRALSYSGPDNANAWSYSNPQSAINPSYTTSTMMAGMNNFAPQPRSARSSMYPVEVSSTAIDPSGLPICPRSQPTTGYRDWYTIKEMSNIDICPTCISFVGNTRYNDLFVRSLSRPYNEPSVCAMSQPWVRVAFIQSLKQNKPGLEYVRAAATLPPGKEPCPGHKKGLRAWYRVEDRQSKSFVPDFYVCSVCVGIVDKVFGPVGDMFDRRDASYYQDRCCSLHANGKHFQSLMQEFDHALVRYKSRTMSQTASLEPLVRQIRRITRYQSCPRDVLQPNRTWHLHPDLPEFTLCEECYDAVVSPVHDRSIARDISKVLRPVPQKRSSTNPPSSSCQLYSDRMRRVFLDAVSRRDFTLLREAVQKRVMHEHRLHDMNKLFEDDMKAGIDRRIEIERNRQLWRSLE